MTGQPLPSADSDARSTARRLARLSVLAALASCSLNCVFNQLTLRGAETLRPFGNLVSGGSLSVVVAGIVLGISALVGGARNRSPDTAAIALIGLTLNLGIVFVICWYFAVARSQ
jgi:drug/metabolite transporter (DMT)-like permease